MLGNECTCGNKCETLILGNVTQFNKSIVIITVSIYAHGYGFLPLSMNGFQTLGGKLRHTPAIDWHTQYNDIVLFHIYALRLPYSQIQKVSLAA